MHAEMKPCLQCLMKLCRLKDISLLLFLLLLSLTLLLTLSLCLGREKHGQLWWVPSSSLVEGDWTPPFFPGHSHELTPAVFLQLFYLFQTHCSGRRLVWLFLRTLLITSFRTRENFQELFPLCPWNTQSPSSAVSVIKNGHTSRYCFCGIFLFNRQHFQCPSIVLYGTPSAHAPSND